MLSRVTGSYQPCWAVAGGMGDRHLILLCRPSLLAHILAGDLSQMSHRYCPGRAQPLMGTLLWLPGALLFPSFLLSQSASSPFCSLSPKTFPKPLPRALPAVPPYVFLSLPAAPDSHLAPPFGLCCSGLLSHPLS